LRFRKQLFRKQRFRKQHFRKQHFRISAASQPIPLAVSQFINPNYKPCYHVNRINSKMQRRHWFEADRTVAEHIAAGCHTNPSSGYAWRKVRAPQDKVVGNAHRPKGQGKCNRKQTAARAVGPRGKGETVR